MVGTSAAPRPGRWGPSTRRFVPSMLLGGAEDRDRGGRGTPRSARDWVVDGLLFLIAVVFGVIAFDGLQPRGDLLDALDVAGGVVLCAALWVRRRWPVGVALLATPLGAFASCSGAAGAIVLFSLAVHRETRTVLAVAALQVPVIFAYAAVRPDPELSFWWLVLFVHVVLGLLIGWGTVVRARRELVRSLQERAVRAESEQQLRVAQARDHERARIAREMHDVLAHRISLLSLHAGALEFRRDASPDEVAAAAGVIRTSAHQALEDLRQVIGVLRDGDSTATGAGPDHAPRASEVRPQPGLGDLPALLQESRTAGVRIVDRLEVAGDPPPGAIGRTAYRVVQEGLTNARKHAWGAVVHVATAGGPGDGLTVEVRTPAAVGGTGRDPGIPGTGTAWWACRSGPRSRAGGSRRGPRPTAGSCSAPGCRGPRDERPAGRRPAPPGPRGRGPPPHLEHRAAVVSDPSPSTVPVRVLLVDDDALVRSALSMMLGGAEGVRVVAEAADGDEVPEAVAVHRPDVVLMDIRMPRVDGLTATERLRAGGDPPEVVVLTTLNADDQVLRALRAGAAGFLLKDTPPAEIVRAIRLVAGGEAMLSPAVTRRLIDHVADPAHEDRRGDAERRLRELTEREREVAVALGRGASNAEIGAELFMSVPTVKAHVSRVLQKLDCNNRVQIALLAHDAGLV